MASGVVVKVENLSKKYTIRHQGGGSRDGLRHVLEAAVAAPFKALGQKLQKAEPWKKRHGAALDIVQSPNFSGLVILLWLSLSAFGQASGATITAKSGELRDVQAAVNNAPDGGTVIIPNGTFTWDKSVFVTGGTYPDGSLKGKSVNIFGASKGGVTIVNNHPAPTTYTEQAILAVAPSPNFTMEIKNLVFTIGPNVTGPFMGNMQLSYQLSGGWGQSALTPGKPPLIHDCTFTVNATIAKGLRIFNNGGVIWNCTFNSDGVSFTDGIAFQGFGTDTYPTPSTMGTLDTTGLANTYVEDSTFNNFGPGYALDLSGNARMVIRHCKFNNSLVGSHGYESDPAGMRHAEVYNCKFEGKSYTWLHIRGGTWAVFDNDFATGTSAVTFTLIALQRRAVQLNPPCPTKYPIPRQIGQGWAKKGGSAYPGYESLGNGYVLDPCYFWNNKGFTVGYTDDEDTCGNRLQTKDFVKEGRDYYTDRPKPGYAPYAYPHPLRATSPNRRQNRH